VNICLVYADWISGIPPSPGFDTLSRWERDDSKPEAVQQIVNLALIGHHVALVGIDLRAVE